MDSRQWLSFDSRSNAGLWIRHSMIILFVCRIGAGVSSSNPGEKHKKTPSTESRKRISGNQRVPHKEPHE